MSAITKTNPLVTLTLVDGRQLLSVKALGEPVIAAPNVRARAASLTNLAAGKAELTLKAGVPCKVRVPYTVACWERVQAELAKGKGQAPATKLAAVSTGDFVQYALRRKWLTAV